MRTLFRLLAQLLLLSTTLVSALGPLPHAAQAAAPLTVTVTIDRVRMIDEIEECFLAGDADFYAVITIDGRRHRTGTIGGQDDIRPGWRHQVAVDPALTIAPISLEVFDEDGGACDADDHADISGDGDRNLDLSVNLRSCAISGDRAGGCWRPLSAAGTQDDNAAIDYRVDVNLPRTTFWGYVYDGAPPDRGRPVDAHRVTLFDQVTGEELESVLTRGDGSFGFDNIRPPADARVRLEIAECRGAIRCDEFPADVAPIDIQPIRAEPRALVFPGCPPSGACTYAPVDFFIRRDLAAAPPLQITGATPESPTPTVALRDDPARATSDAVALSGEGIHDWLEVFLFRADCATFPDCPRYAAPIVGPAPDGRALGVRVPPEVGELGLAAYAQRWFWAVRNTLEPNPGRQWARLAPFHLNFPAIYGFRFENEGDRASYDEFRGVYGDNATICIGAFGLCVTRIDDPVYALFYELAYKGWAGGDGSCAGMAATSLLMRRGELRPEQFTPTAHFAAGLPGSPGNDRLPPRPAGFNPRNLWGEIRVNHGVQTSSEYISERLRDAGSVDFTNGDPNARLAEIRGDPGANILCLRKHDNSGGHCVTPYAVEDIDATRSRIWIYDNNFPDNPTRFVEIDRAANRYSLPDYPGYDGRGIFTYPASIWRNERHMPGLGDLLDHALVAVFGDADALYTDPSGGQFGRRPDGSFANTLPGLVPLSPDHGPRTPARNIPVLLPLAQAAPTVAAQGGGQGYTFMAAQGGLLLGLAAPGASSADQFTPAYDAGRLESFRLSPGSDLTGLEPRVALAPADRQRAVFTWTTLAVPADRAITAGGSPADLSTFLTNTTGAAVQPFIVLDTIDGAAEVVAQRYFGPFTVPDGATITATIADWPIGARLRVTIDNDGDGTIDETTIARGIVPGERVRQGLQLLYPFDEGSGAVVHDTSGVGAPIDLALPADATRWLDGALAIETPTLITSAAPATRLTEAISQTGEITIEGWLRPRAAQQIGHAQIVNLSAGPRDANFSLAQEREGDLTGDGYVARMVTDATDRLGRNPDLKSRRGGAAGELVHVVYTRDALGAAYLYLNGELKARRQVPGGLSTWKPSYHLALANEMTGDRPWLGEYHLLAIYNRALSPAEVRQNLAAGADGAGLTPYSGTIASYRFDEGAGSQANDSSGFSQPLPISVDPAATRWSAQGLEVNGPASLATALPAVKVADGSYWTDEVSVELWVDPATLASGQATTLLTIAGGAPGGTITLSQQVSSDQRMRFAGRIRTSATDAPGREPTLRSRPIRADGLIHLVYTRDALGQARLYVNGVYQSVQIVPGTLRTWDEQFTLFLANSPGGSQPWRGTYRSLNIANRALSPGEVGARYQAGATTP